ncbi:MAG: Rieske (2Fe-2S) protein [Oligoflexia bacterium]|nr:Rieske (2Fe-2S) protein [Oligoflexia bacterium]MBF0365619.1 Rieske (2Fe-2S) protein [Oligoflexia bacterium]
MSQIDRTLFLKTKLSRMDQTASERKLELERKSSEYIFIAKMSDLLATKGKYFIDYEMRPALAFQSSEDGLPILISAKCTHLGCTVGADLDENSRILCPCHVSYFDIKSGMPHAGSPAKAPLPHIGWVIMDKQSKIVASKHPKREVEIVEKLDMDSLDHYSIYIAKKFASKATGEA